MFYPWHEEELEELMEEFVEEEFEEEEEYSREDIITNEILDFDEVYYYHEGQRTSFADYMFLLDDEEDFYEPLFETTPEDADTEIGEEDYEALLNLANPNPALVTVPSILMQVGWEDSIPDASDIEKMQCDLMFSEYGINGDVDPSDFTSDVVTLSSGKPVETVFQEDLAKEGGYAFGVENLGFMPFSINEMLIEKDNLITSLEDYNDQLSLIIDSLILLQKTDKLPEIPVVWDAKAKTYLVYNYGTHKLVSFPSVLKYVSYFVRYSLQELTGYYGLLKPTNFSRKIVEIPIWDSYFVSIYILLQSQFLKTADWVIQYIKSTPIFFVFREFKLESPFLKTSKNSLFGLEYFFIIKSICVGLSGLRNWRSKVVYVFVQKFFFVLMGGVMFMISKLKNYVRFFITRLPGGPVIINYYDNLKIIDYFTLSFISPGQSHEENLKDILQSVREEPASYNYDCDEEPGISYIYAQGVLNGEYIGEFWENYDFRITNDTWVPLLAFSSNLRTYPILPPTSKDIKKLLIWDYDLWADAWETSKDLWFKERDAGVIERAAYNWKEYNEYEYDPGTLSQHIFDSKQERIMYIRYLIIKKFVQKKCQKLKK